MITKLEYNTSAELGMHEIIENGLDYVIGPSMSALMQKVRKNLCKEMNLCLKENNKFTFTLRVELE